MGAAVPKFYERTFLRCANNLKKKLTNPNFPHGLLHACVRSKVIPNQGCQMVYFRTKNPNLGQFWRALDWRMYIYFMAIWNILRTFEIFYDQLVHFVLIWYIFSRFWYHEPRKIWQPCSKLHTLANLQQRHNFKQQFGDRFLWISELVGHSRYTLSIGSYW
jgi:hypothetical protein